ncbi:Rho GTPase activator (Rgd1), putative [Aspergillus lentulus]|uniref:Rho GTPase activator (Rgd1), putative n=1 Tax=Aspergillus lentulus TaxID=293939 RepID=A0ABQ1AP97_ASPLE|nr:Rho GTPase activator (Rgd1), putative [Aspergillus lentulus]GFF45738.1 Rho GTPase activator (Rgd1), putative [Aspergillus lentulus]GFF83475.1 Rho GTPase activator (Rgd1), putative [Aspergillus lentulus]GFF85562.1 Rho GTPase activator (Rgd1), putative [Aspergillus lentulus]
MADVATPDGSAPIIPVLRDPDAPPSSAGSAGLSEVRPGPPPMTEEVKARLDKVIYSDIGITTLLARLKQSVASAKDFSAFLKKRSSLEEEHAQGLRKLSRSLNDAANRPDNRQGTYGSSYNDLNRFHERMADHGLQFAVSLQQMADDLHELATNIEKGRKQWKQTGLSAEKRVTEAEAAAEKAKAKYESLAEQYDRVKTGDKQGGKFGLKGHKSAAQHEEELLRKVQNADGDYAAKVTAAQAARRELISTHRPQAVQNIQKLIAECDSGLTLQLQKFATFNEKLLLGQGLSITPLDEGAGSGSIGPRSLYEVVRQIDNQKDFQDYILSYEHNPGAVTSEQVQYQRHPTLGGTPTPVAPASQPSTQNKRQSTMFPSSFSQQHLPIGQPSTQPSGPAAAPSPAPASAQSTQPSSFQPHPDSFSSPPPFQPPYPTSSGLPAQDQHNVNKPPVTAPANPLPPPGNSFQQNLPPLRPVFGVSLEDLYARDGTAVPMIVYQCLQAIELFGLDVEGIYRLSGSANHINHMKSLFDNDSSQVDFTNPESFYHDVNSVAGLLKQFFRELPDPLFTSRYYSDFINAARIDDDIQRRDSLHALVNNLPDAHYATLRALILHLNKVQEHYMNNRMNAGNIAICFGPTLMGASSGGNIADAGWQVRVIETILVNTFQIFDDD